MLKHYDIPAVVQGGWRHVGIHDQHAQLLFNVLLLPQINTYLEIGCGNGVSTSAALAAKRDRGGVLDLTVCDIDIKPHVLDLIGSNAKTLESKSLDVLASTKGWDAIFADGNHQPENVAAEIAELNRLDVPIVIAHDTANVKRPGPAQFLDAYSDWWHWHDPRWHGLFIAARIAVDELDSICREWRETN